MASHHIFVLIFKSNSTKTNNAKQQMEERKMTHPISLATLTNEFTIMTQISRGKLWYVALILLKTWI